MLMDASFQKAIVIALIFAGEALAIYAEMSGAKTHSSLQSPFLQTFLRMLIIMAVGGALLVAGYMLGFSAFRNIWIVSVISITSILIIEPTLAYTVFQQLPTRGALIGLVMGAGGFIAACFTDPERLQTF